MWFPYRREWYILIPNTCRNACSTGHVSPNSEWRILFFQGYLLTHQTLTVGLLPPLLLLQTVRLAERLEAFPPSSVTGYRGFISIPSTTRKIFHLQFCSMHICKERVRLVNLPTAHAFVIWNWPFNTITYTSSSTSTSASQQPPPKANSLISLAPIISVCLVL